MAAAPSARYPWATLQRTVLLWVTWVSAGCSDSVRGPTLMDLRDLAQVTSGPQPPPVYPLLQVDLSTVASIFALKSFGGLTGALGTSLLLGTLRPSREILALAATLVGAQTLATRAYNEDFIITEKAPTTGWPVCLVPR